MYWTYRRPTFFRHGLRMPRNENKNSGLALQIKSICQLECCLQRFGVEKCLVIGFSEMAFLHWKQVLRVQFQHRIWLSWFFLRFFCLQKGQRIRFIFSSGFAARATSISTTICQKKNREEDLNKGEYRYLKCTRSCRFFFHTVIISICVPLFQLKPIYLMKTWKWDGYKFFWL